MKTLKLILNMAAGLIAGGLIGLLGVGLVVSVFTHKTFSEYLSGFGKIDFPEMAAVVAVALVAAVVSFFIAVTAHEAGHLVGGLLTGYKLVSFRIFNLTLIRIDGRLRLKRFELAGTGGQCVLLPPDLPVEKIPTGLYNAGGVLANLLLLPLAVVWLLAVDNPFLKEAIWIFILVDMILLLLNGIPMCSNAVGNDAYNQRLLKQDLESKRALMMQLRANALIQEGVRPKDMPDELFDAPYLTEADYRNNLKVYAPMARASRLLDCGDFAGAHAAFEELYTHKEDIMPLYVKELECELVYLRLLAGDKEGAGNLLGKDLRQYIENYRKVMSSKERVLCAIALLMENDREKAEKIYRDLLGRKDEYLFQGEVESDLWLMQQLLDSGSSPL